MFFERGTANFYWLFNMNIKEQVYWINLMNEYTESVRKLKKGKSDIKQKIKTTIQDDKDIELLNEMIRDTNFSQEKFDRYCKKIIHEEDLHLVKLSNRQREIAELKVKKFSSKEIAEKLNVTQQYVNEQIRVILKRIIEAYIDISKGIAPNLSKQQKKIYLLMQQNKENKEIAQLLSTSEKNIAKQKSIINKKRLYYQNYFQKVGG